MIEDTIHRCGFCRTWWQTPEKVIKHEGKCNHNPKNKTCETCSLLSSAMCKHQCVQGRLKMKCSHWIQKKQVHEIRGKN